PEIAPHSRYEADRAPVARRRPAPDRARESLLLKATLRAHNPARAHSEKSPRRRALGHASNECQVRPLAPTPPPTATQIEYRNTGPRRDPIRRGREES